MMKPKHLTPDATRALCEQALQQVEHAVLEADINLLLHPGSEEHKRTLAERQGQLTKLEAYVAETCS
jgi:hypothetical protein